MLGRNIKKYRLLSGMSLRDMANKLNLSHETIKKYEEEILTPDSKRLIEISRLLNVNISNLFNDYKIPELKFENFRKQSKLSKTKEKGLLMLIKDEISEYLELLNYTDIPFEIDKNEWSFKVKDENDIENITTKIRNKLGVSDDSCLDNLTDRLENNNFLILEINYDENFDGFAEFVDNLAFIILSSKGYERNRFTLAHELGHLVLDFSKDLTNKEKEKYCNHFAASLLLTKKSMIKEFGIKNEIKERNVSLNEIKIIAERYKVSMNSVIMRLYELGFINEYKKKNLFILLSKTGLINESLKNTLEHPTKKKQIIFMLEAENIISSDEAIKYLGVTTDEYYNFLNK